MSIAEKDGQVVLTLSKKDWQLLSKWLNAFMFFAIEKKEIVQMCERLKSAADPSVPEKEEKD